MSIFPRRRNNLILKHEILSEECDMFRSSLPRKIYANRLIQMIGILVGSGLIHYCYLKLNVFILISLAVGIIFVLQRTIEGTRVLLYLTCLFYISFVERLLFIKGLGVQYTRINGFYQEVCNFYPLESIDKFYIFEAVDGLKYRHFLTIRLRNQENIIIFEVSQQIMCAMSFNVFVEYETAFRLSPPSL